MTFNLDYDRSLFNYPVAKASSRGVTCHILFFFIFLCKHGGGVPRSDSKGVGNITSRVRVRGNKGVAQTPYYISVDVTKALH